MKSIRMSGSTYQKLEELALILMKYGQIWT